MFPSPSIEEVVVLDRRLEMVKATSANLRQRFGARVRFFTESKDACRAVYESETLPALAVNDRVGLNEVEAYGDSFDGIVRVTSPLTLIILFSGSAFKKPKQVKQWIREGKIDFAIEKRNPEELYQLIEQIRLRWNSEPAKKLRNHIATQPHAELPGMSDGVDEVSLIDEYREILKGTPRGDRYAADWDKVLSGPVNA